VQASAAGIAACACTRVSFVRAVRDDARVSLTSMLAVIGTATGSASLTLQTTLATRDRARVGLGMGFTHKVESKPEAWIDVHNRGRRPTTLREVGFYAGLQAFATQQLSGTGPFKTPLTSDPVFLDAGRSIRLHGSPDAIDAGFPADFPLRAYAMDQHGRYLWGDAAGVSRWLVGDDPPFVDEDEAFRRLFVDRRGELMPAQVEPAWKLWKRRELRRPQTWVPTDQVRYVSLQYQRRGES
jgi:hypothetical protein